MIELIELVGGMTLPTFFTTLLIFGFAPGFVLRIIVRLYPKDDPRRRELVAELYAMKRIERPLWVAEQIETAMFEGPVERRRQHRAKKQRYALGQRPRYQRFLMMRSNRYRMWLEFREMRRGLDRLAPETMQALERLRLDGDSDGQ